MEKMGHCYYMDKQITVLTRLYRLARPSLDTTAQPTNRLLTKGHSAQITRSEQDTLQIVSGVVNLEAYMATITNRRCHTVNAQHSTAHPRCPPARSIHPFPKAPPSHPQPPPDEYSNCILATK